MQAAHCLAYLRVELCLLLMYRHQHIELHIGNEAMPINHVGPPTKCDEQSRVNPLATNVVSPAVSLAVSPAHCPV